MTFFPISKNFIKRTNPLITTSSSSLLKTNSQLSQQKKQLLKYGNKSFIRNIHYLQPLPYSIEEGLKPLFSAETLQNLYNYQGFLIDNLNKLTNGNFLFYFDKIFFFFC